MNFDDYTEEEIRVLYKCLKAEWATSYPKIGNEKNKNLSEEYLQGTIIIKRQREGGKAKTLIYKPYDELVRIRDGNDQSEKEKALNYFSLKNGKLVIASWSSNEITYNIEGEMPNASEYQNSSDYSITLTEIDYKSIVGIHTLPFELCLSMLINEEDEKFVEKVAELGLNSQIEITIFDNLTTTTSVEKTHAEEHITYSKWIDYTVNEEDTETIPQYYVTGIINMLLANGAVETEQEAREMLKDDIVNVQNIPQLSNSIYDFSISRDEYTKYSRTNQEITSTEKEDTDYTITTTRVNSSSSYTVTLTAAKSWIAQVKNENYKYENLDNQTTNSAYTKYDYNEDGGIEQNSATDPDIINFINRNESHAVVDREWGSTGVTIEERYDEEIVIDGARKQEHKQGYRELLEGTTTTVRYEYQKEAGGTKKENIGKDFYEIYKKHKYAKGNLVNVDTWLYEMLAETESGNNYVAIMKYLLYKCKIGQFSDEEIGEIEDYIEGLLEPRSVSQTNTATSSNSLSQFIRYLHSWEAGVTEGLATYKNSSGVDCYKILPDGDGGYAVGYGVDIDTHGAKMRALGYSTNNGDLIPVEVVDQIEREELDSNKSIIESRVAGLDLTEYQIYALLSRAYNCGPAGAVDYTRGSPSLNFVDSYKRYWNQERDDRYKQTTTFDHSLYTQYMSKPINSSGVLEGRRKSEWSLFQTGYFGYDLKYEGHGIDEYCVVGGTGGAGGTPTSFTNNINLYNSDGTVNTQAIDQLENWLTVDLLNTKIHNGTYEQQNGPFATWWKSENNWFTSAGLEFQCTWYVYGRASQYLQSIGSKYSSWPGTKNNATKWYYSSTDGGQNYFQCGSEPRANSIAVWSNGGAGHVAYVEAVDSVNQIVYISHAGGGKSWYGINSYSFNEMKTLYGYNLLGYVYLDSPK